MQLFGGRLQLEVNKKSAHFQPHVQRAVALHGWLCSSQISGVRFSWKLQQSACTNIVPSEQRKLSLNLGSETSPRAFSWMLSLEKNWYHATIAHIHSGKEQWEGNDCEHLPVTLPTKVHMVPAMVFPVVMYRCESWTIKRLSAEKLVLSNCGAGEDSWESLGHQGDETVNPKGNQPWIFIRRTDAEAEASIFWPPDVMSQLTGKDPDAGKDWEQKGAAEDEMVGWHHQFKSSNKLDRLGQ